MAMFIVGYDKKEGEDYGPLEDRLKEFGTYWHHLDSTWLVRTDMSHTGLRDELYATMQPGNRLLVIDVTGQPAAWAGFPERARTWLKEHL